MSLGTMCRRQEMNDSITVVATTTFGRAAARLSRKAAPSMDPRPGDSAPHIILEGGLGNTGAICDRAAKRGGEAWLVGGCARPAAPRTRRTTTSPPAPPSRILELFRLRAVAPISAWCWSLRRRAVEVATAAASTNGDGSRPVPSASRPTRAGMCCAIPSTADADRAPASARLGGPRRPGGRLVRAIGDPEAAFRRLAAPAAQSALRRASAEIEGRRWRHIAPAPRSHSRRLRGGGRLVAS
jgi:hypothetical protein